MRLEFEQGPIRPPSEARSLLLRVTRNCPWNRCEFCPVYKNEPFSIRPVEDVKKDIDTASDMVERIRELAWKTGRAGRLDGGLAEALFQDPESSDSFRNVVLWVYYGQESVFLQDANSLVVKTSDLAEILTYLKEKFPKVRRITSYARSQTLARKSVDDLKILRAAGLNRIHVGLESGSDEVLTFVRKGTTAAQHIEGGRRVVEAGIELSEYVMPGLGGRALSEVHARETARVLNAINPSFIRLRSLALPQGTPLRQKWESGQFERLNDEEIVREIRLLVENLDGITSYVASDHMLNLLEEVEGQLPQEKPRILASIDRFLALPQQERLLFQLGRRLGLFRFLEDLERHDLRLEAEALRRRIDAASPEELEQKIRLLAERYI